MTDKKQMSLEDKIKINREQLQELTDYRNIRILWILSTILLLFVFFLGLYQYNLTLPKQTQINIVAYSFGLSSTLLAFFAFVRAGSILAFFKVLSLIKELKSDQNYNFYQKV